MSIDKDLLQALTPALAQRALCAEVDDQLIEERAESQAERASQAANRRNRYPAT
ncbi:hypothetical protein GYB14_06360 [bacterium]|nr:hypothetical protein [bacterium]